MAEAPPSGIIYFHYSISPYARRVVWYLAFRRIAYAECIQPRILPRPDLTALGVKYRRTPTMAIGRDFYLDSRLIISKLEELFPASEQHPAFSDPTTAGLAALLNKFVVDASLFVIGVQTMPLDSALFTNEAFKKDRAGFFAGGPTSKEELVARRNQAMVHLRQAFDIFETLLADGRKWIGGTDRPTLADLEGVWALDWILRDLRPPQEYFADHINPKTHAWRNRFMEAVEVAKAQAPKPVTLEGPVAVKQVLSADFTDKDKFVDPNDPIGLKEGTNVQLYPLDGGGYGPHKDSGRLIKLTQDEVAIAVKAENGETAVHVHAPRWNFRIQEVSEARL